VVLSVLARGEGPLNPSRLQGLVIQSPGGLTKTLRRLESAGYIRRLHDPADRRALLVALTPKGGRAARQIDSVMERHYDELLSDLETSERAQLRDLVRKVLDRLEPQMGMPSSRAVDGPR
jgi:DNA-binding MarR family transcriptional regulator